MVLKFPAFSGIELGKGRPRTKASYNELIVELFEHIRITGRQSSYLPDLSEDDVPLDQLGEVQKKRLGNVTRKF